ncbi:MAG: NnrS family protein [Terasakiella sp.]|uniref:NnrS family protein n=1 Tax=unclassified Terasakiella TaxID=2614952 RepID=UPI003AFF9E0A
MARVFLDIGEPVQPYSGPVLFSSGHRVFFLFTALSGVAFLLAWLFGYAGMVDLSLAWHGHEMVFGFASAAIGGFLMAAVPKWTSSKNFVGRPVVIMAIFWLLGRVGILAAELNDAFVYLAWLDLLYLPMLSYEIANRIVGAQNKRNFIVPLILVFWCLSNVAWHFWDTANAARAGVYMIIAIASLISARVIPAFTQNALRMKLQSNITCTTPQWTHLATVVLVLLLAIATLFDAPDLVKGVIASATAIVLIYRMARWHSFQTLDNPIVWVLHAAYVWLPIGFALTGVAHLTDFLNPNQALHALTTGGIGMLILAVASRAALGHSGRPLKASGLTVAAYLIVTAATFVRVIELNSNWVIASGVLWVIGYGLFAAVYAPILIRPRIDGLPG